MGGGSVSARAAPGRAFRRRRPAPAVRRGTLPGCSGPGPGKLYRDLANRRSHPAPVMIPDARPRIVATEEAIRPHVRRTPVVQLSGAELGLECRTVTLKLELLQHAGAFKTRGAFSNLL